MTVYCSKYKTKNVDGVVEPVPTVKFVPGCLFLSMQPKFPDADANAGVNAAISNVWPNSGGGHGGAASANVAIGDDEEGVVTGESGAGGTVADHPAGVKMKKTQDKNQVKVAKCIESVAPSLKLAGIHRKLRDGMGEKLANLRAYVRLLVQSCAPKEKIDAARASIIQALEEATAFGPGPEETGGSSGSNGSGSSAVAGQSWLCDPAVAIDPSSSTAVLQEDTHHIGSIALSNPGHTELPAR